MRWSGAHDYALAFESAFPRRYRRKNIGDERRDAALVDYWSGIADCGITGCSEWTGGMGRTRGASYCPNACRPGSSTLAAYRGITGSLVCS